MCNGQNQREFKMPGTVDQTRVNMVQMCMSSKKEGIEEREPPVRAS